MLTQHMRRQMGGVPLVRLLVKPGTSIGCFWSGVVGCAFLVLWETWPGGVLMKPASDM
jgi:hypothetical protein